MSRIHFVGGEKGGVGNTTTDALGIIERHRVKVWVRNAYKELARINA